MRCIEIKWLLLENGYGVVININMRCIEIIELSSGEGLCYGLTLTWDVLKLGYSILLNTNRHKININMRCIEMIILFQLTQ